MDDDLSTKSEEHSRRTGVISAKVSIDEIIDVAISKEVFLRNSANKVHCTTYQVVRRKRY